MIKNHKFDYESLFKLCLQYSDNLFLILSSDLTVQYINPTATKILKWTKKESYNQSIQILFQQTDIEPFIDSDYYLKAPQQDQPLKKSTKTTHVFHHDINQKVIWNILPIHADLILVIGKIITELTKQQFADLHFQDMIKYAPGLFYWKDRNSVYQRCNEEFAKLAGLNSIDDIIGKTDFDLIWKDRASSYVAVDKTVIETGVKKLNHEEWVQVTNGTIRAITNKVPLCDYKGNIVGVLGITTNITHQKEIEQALRSLAKEAAEAANHAKTEFIANMSHDIRTPLTGVIGMSNLLEEAEGSPELKQYAHDIHSCGEQLLNMLNSILDVVSADHVHEQDLVKEPFDLLNCIREIVDIEKPTTTSKNLVLSLHHDPKTPNCIINDKTKIHRILLNLIGNAIKFTSKGSITIETHLVRINHNQVTIRFVVTDTGIGIPVDQQDKVFDRFFRANPSYKGQYAGHGVGLHIAQSYAKLLGTEIKLISQPNEGTSFFFELTSEIGTVENTLKQPEILKANEGLPYQYYLNSIEKPTLLLLHGWCCSPDDFQFQIPYFSEHYNLLLPDYSQLVATSTIPDQNHALWIAKQITNLLDQKKINHLIIIAHSMGGIIALHLANQLQNRLSALIIVDTTIPAQLDHIGDLDEFLGEEGLLRLREFIAKHYIDSQHDNLMLMQQKQQDMLDTFSLKPDAFIKLLAHCYHDSARIALPMLKKISCPIFFIAREHPAADLLQLQQCIPKEHIACFKTGHFVMLNQPNEFNRQCYDFLLR